MEGLTNKQILTKLEDLGLTEELEALAKEKGKQVSKLTRSELMSLAPAKVEATKEEKSTMTAEHNNTKVMCVVTDHYTVSSFEENVPNAVHVVSYGNKYGMTTARVSLNGMPQYLSIGTISRLKQDTMPSLGLDANGKEIATLGNKRFSVVQVDGWTDEQLAAQAKAQSLRKV